MYCKKGWDNMKLSDLTEEQLFEAVVTDETEIIGKNTFHVINVKPTKEDIKQAINKFPSK